MDDTTRNLEYTHGTEQLNVAEFIAQEVKKSAPLLAWADPQATQMRDDVPGRYKNFQPLVEGAPQWPDDIVLSEARLFWQSSALHVVAHAVTKDGRGCRWARIKESPGTEVTRNELGVLALRDYARFGMDPWQGAPDNLTAIEYREHGRLRAWRLLPGS